MRGEEVSHEVIGFFRLGKVRVVPKGVGKAFKHDELSAVVAGAEECAMENGGAAKKDVAAAGDEESGRHSVKIGEEGREDGIARVGVAGAGASPCEAEGCPAGTETASEGADSAFP